LTGQGDVVYNEEKFLKYRKGVRNDYYYSIRTQSGKGNGEREREASFFWMLRFGDYH
jgi:hypothetical protein